MSVREWTPSGSPPRVREHSHGTSAASSPDGSPPRVRGTQLETGRKPFTPGITPARTRSITIPASSSVLPFGSPPRVRRARWEVHSVTTAGLVGEGAEVRC